MSALHNYRYIGILPTIYCIVFEVDIFFFGMQFGEIVKQSIKKDITWYLHNLLRPNLSTLNYYDYS